jgi:hypothetical protein
MFVSFSQEEEMKLDGICCVLEMIMNLWRVDLLLVVFHHF